MERCTLKVKDTVFTIPKSNLKILAMTKSIDCKKGFKRFETDDEAINFLKSIGIEVI